RSDDAGKRHRAAMIARGVVGPSAAEAADRSRNDLAFAQARPRVSCHRVGASMSPRGIVIFLRGAARGDMGYQTVLVDRAGAVATLALNRPALDFEHCWRSGRPSSWHSGGMLSS